MANLDVESLCTNISLEETIEDCVKDLFFDKSKIDNLTKPDLWVTVSCSKRIVLIFEIEGQNSFSFLDIKIIRITKKKSFETSVYQKSTFSGVFTNFQSFIPMKYKYVVSLFLNMRLLRKVSRGNCKVQGNL